MIFFSRSFCHKCLGKVEGELAKKTESFKKAEEELMNDVVAAYGERFQDVVAQFTCTYPDTDPSHLMSPSASWTVRLCHEDDSF